MRSQVTIKTLEQRHWHSKYRILLTLTFLIHILVVNLLNLTGNSFVGRIISQTKPLEIKAFSLKASYLSLQ